MNSHAFTKTFAKSILENATKFHWTLQGFGMLRLHLSDEFRLNVWDSIFRVKNVSTMHTHPWNFESLIVAGRLQNQRFSESCECEGTANYNCAVIKPGAGGGILDNEGIVSLGGHTVEWYNEGELYSQEANEIHVSSPDDGTVTLNHRVRVGDDVAKVYWPYGEEWVSAEPRDATEREIKIITHNALETWF